jgi:hypothetical protein
MVGLHKVTASALHESVGKEDAVRQRDVIRCSLEELAVPNQKLRSIRDMRQSRSTHFEFAN